MDNKGSQLRGGGKSSGGEGEGRVMWGGKRMIRFLRPGGHTHGKQVAGLEDNGRGNECREGES